MILSSKASAIKIQIFGHTNEKKNVTSPASFHLASMKEYQIIYL